MNNNQGTNRGGERSEEQMYEKTIGKTTGVGEYDRQIKQYLTTNVSEKNKYGGKE